MNFFKAVAWIFFRVNWSAWIFFQLISSCANIFFVLHPPPHKFSNGSSLSFVSSFPLDKFCRIIFCFILFQKFLRNKGWSPCWVWEDFGLLSLYIFYLLLITILLQLLLCFTARLSGFSSLMNFLLTGSQANVFLLRLPTFSCCL